VDSQSVKTTGVGERGYNGGKQIKGRKRHILVNTEGVSAQSQGPLCQRLRQRRDKAASGGRKELLPLMSHLWLDAGYNGQGKGADWVEKILG
jgi:putative transposase